MSNFKTERLHHLPRFLLAGLYKTSTRILPTFSIAWEDHLCLSTEPASLLITGICCFKIPWDKQAVNSDLSKGIGAESPGNVWQELKCLNIFCRSGLKSPANVPLTFSCSVLLLVFIFPWEKERSGESPSGLRGRRCGFSSDFDVDFLLDFGIVMTLGLVRAQLWVGWSSHAFDPWGGTRESHSFWTLACLLFDLSSSW